MFQDDAPTVYSPETQAAIDAGHIRWTGSQWISADVAAVLDAVKRTGRSAQPTPIEAMMPGAISALVFSVAVERGLSPVALQADVNAYVASL